MEIEGLCLQSAIQAGGVEWEGLIVATAHRLERTPYKPEGDSLRLSDKWNAVHREFHEALVAACPSSRLLTFRASLFEQSERYRRLSVPMYQKEHGEDRRVNSEHKGIVDATIDRDEDLAVRLLKSHIQTTSNILVEGLEHIALSV
jgi:DNA-binding GntR family transcriptional regulator